MYSWCYRVQLIFKCSDGKFSLGNLAKKERRMVKCMNKDACMYKFITFLAS
jgi:hypothetical protein